MHTGSRKNICRKLWLILVVLFTGPCIATAAQVTVLTYHDIVNETTDDHYAVTRSAFVSQMDYLQNNNFHVLSLSELKIYEKFPEQMPKNSVLLTFDDGLKSYSEFVVPLLEIYGFPSTASIVTGWLDGLDVPPEYHKKLMNWSTIKKLNRSPLVEFVSHTHQLHQGIRANPQGSMEAASITRRYQPDTRSYESEHQFRQRIHIDLKTSKSRFKEELGVYPDAISWPYGFYDEILVTEARKLGLKYHLTLNDGPTKLNNLPTINRIMLLKGQSLIDFANELNYRNIDTKARVIEISLDEFLGKSLEQKEKILSSYLDRHQSIGANTLIIPAFSKKEGLAFFYNRQTRVGTDILSRVINSFRSKLGIRYVYIKVPAKVGTSDPSPTFKDLARLIKFEGVVFDEETSKQTATNIKDTINKYKSNIRFGTYGLKNPLLKQDFVIAPISLSEPLRKTRKKLAKVNKTKIPVYYLAIQSKNNKKAFFKKASQTFDFLNAEHTGFKLNQSDIKLNSVVTEKKMATQKPPATGG